MGLQVISLIAYASDMSAMQQLAETAQRQLGPIDIAVANSGLYSFGLAWELSELQWDETLAVVLKGVWITCKDVIPHMLLRCSGKIICIGSTGSFKSLYGVGHYSATEHGVIGLFKWLAIEFEPYEIHINA